MFAAALGLFACSSNPKSNKTMNEYKGKKILVAYFSWSGNTEAAAKYIAQKTNADIFVIEREKPYPTEYGPCTEDAKAEKERGDRPAIKGKIEIWHSTTWCLSVSLCGGTPLRCRFSHSWSSTTSRARPSYRSVRLTAVRHQRLRTSRVPRLRATTATASASSPRKWAAKTWTRNKVRLTNG